MEKFHIGVIPDGNRRWARARNLSDFEGHKQGAKLMFEVIEWFLKKPEIKEISIYAFSEENFKRSIQEKQWLNKVYSQGIIKLFNEKFIYNPKTKIKFITTSKQKIISSGLFQETLHEFQRIERRTENHDEKILNILIGYTGKSEIVRAISKPLSRLKNLFFGLNEQDITNALQIKNSCDFVIRSGYEEAERESKSGFLIWQSAYSENYHIRKNWGDVTIKDLDEAWDSFLHTRKLKGK